MTPSAGTGESASPDRVLVNGRPGESISVLDRGLHFGDGLFETIACRHGRPRLLSLHMERLTRGCRRLGIRLDDQEGLRKQVESLALGTEAAIVKLIVTRGRALARGYASVGAEETTCIALRYPWPQEDSAAAREGVCVRIASLRLGENPALAGLKHTNRLEQVLARAEWQDRRIAEAVMFSHSGRLVSGTMSNVFIVREGRVYTPRIDLCGVAGVMRSVVLREAAGVGIDVQECTLDASDLDRADEIFLTNARIGIWPVRALGGRMLSPGPVTRRLQRALEPLLEGATDA